MMPPKLTVSQNVIDRLKTVNETCLGSLYGMFYKNTILLIGLHMHNGKKSEFIHSLPTEIDLHGVIEAGEGLINEERIKQILNDVDVTDTPIYMSCKISKVKGNENIIETYCNVNNRLERTQFDIISDFEIYSQFVHIRLMTRLSLVSGITSDQIKEAFSVLHKQLSHGQVVFNLPKTSIYMIGGDYENALVGLTGNPTVGEICKESNGLTEGCDFNSQKKKGSPLEIDVLRVIMFKKVTKDCVTDNVKLHAPILQIDKRGCQTVGITLNIDALSVVHIDTKVAKLYETLLESCCRYLRLLEATLLASMKACQDDLSTLSVPETFHFFPEDCGHFVTRAYTKNNTEETLERELLHRQLLLPTYQPMFRRANRFLFKGDVQGSHLILNPHEGIRPSGNGGEVAIVRGKYHYYHYCQDNMDDDGWGCAYRSLQTLASWFRLQGYTDKDVPSFKDIQKCLVDIGDKPFNFIGSKQWIGSTEVNFVLNSLMNITSKILYVSSGEEMSNKGPELLNHFKVHGSPVMIGGGVFAHTILGVDYDSFTGNIKFLILDPHYTGSEDLTIIQKKGWCGWKGDDFWVKTAYYNMCLPQVPKCI